MANIKSAKKRIKVTKTKTERNKVKKSQIKMYTKNIDALVKSGKKDDAKKMLIDATKAIDMAASKGVFHKNNAARKVGRLQKKVDKMS